MDMVSILTMIGGLMFGVIGYFLKKTMEDLKDVKLLSYQTKGDLDVLRNDHQNKHTNLSEKFDELKYAMQELTKEIKELNKRVK